MHLIRIVMRFGYGLYSSFVTVHLGRIVKHSVNGVCCSLGSFIEPVSLAKSDTSPYSAQSGKLLEHDPLLDLCHEFPSLHYCVGVDGYAVNACFD